MPEQLLKQQQQHRHHYKQRKQHRQKNYCCATNITRETVALCSRSRNQPNHEKSMAAMLSRVGYSSPKPVYWTREKAWWTFQCPTHNILSAARAGQRWYRPHRATSTHGYVFEGTMRTRGDSYVISRFQNFCFLFNKTLFESREAGSRKQEQDHRKES